MATSCYTELHFSDSDTQHKLINLLVSSTVAVYSMSMVVKHLYRPKSFISTWFSTWLQNQLVLKDYPQGIWGDNNLDSLK